MAGMTSPGKQESHVTRAWEEPTPRTTWIPLRKCSPTLMTWILFLACAGEGTISPASLPSPGPCRAGLGRLLLP